MYEYDKSPPFPREGEHPFKLRFSNSYITSFEDLMFNHVRGPSVDCNFKSSMRLVARKTLIGIKSSSDEAADFLL